MKLHVCIAAVFVCAAMATLAFTRVNQQAEPADVTDLVRVPLLIFEPPDQTATLHNKPQEDYIDYAWRSFVALHWPAEPCSPYRPCPNRGQADTRLKVPAVRSPVVWETWPYFDQVFLPSGNWGKRASFPETTTDYPSWDSLPVRPSFPSGDGSFEPAPPSPCPLSADVLVLAAINQPGLSIKDGAVGPLADQNGFNVRYQVGLNRAYFEYVKGNQYYDADDQDPTSFQRLPHDIRLPDGAGRVGMIEYKSAWKVLEEEERNSGRFYQRQAYFVGLNGRTCSDRSYPVGLVAFHIHRRTEFGHVAMTFEQIDNVEVDASRIASGHAPSFNPGLLSSNPPPYGKKGFSGAKPPVITATDCRDQDFNCIRGSTVDVSRATPIPIRVQQANLRYRALMKSLTDQDHPAGSVLQYYQLIGAQHADSACSRDWASGVWSEGCPRPNTDTLINAALESYTQLVNLKGGLENYSCRGCHQHARPCGISWSAVPEYKGNLMSYLLSKAKREDTTLAMVLDDYNCNKPLN